MRYCVASRVLAREKKREAKRAVRAPCRGRAAAGRRGRGACQATKPVPAVGGHTRGVWVVAARPHLAQGCSQLTDWPLSQHGHRAHCLLLRRAPLPCSRLCLRLGPPATRLCKERRPADESSRGDAKCRLLLRGCAGGWGVPAASPSAAAGGVARAQQQRCPAGRTGSPAAAATSAAAAAGALRQHQLASHHSTTTPQGCSVRPYWISSSVRCRRADRLPSLPLADKASSVPSCGRNTSPLDLRIERGVCTGVRLFARGL